MAMVNIVFMIERYHFVRLSLTPHRQMDFGKENFYDYQSAQSLFVRVPRQWRFIIMIFLSCVYHNFVKSFAFPIRQPKQEATNSQKKEREMNRINENPNKQIFIITHQFSLLLFPFTCRFCLPRIQP